MEKKLENLILIIFQKIVFFFDTKKNNLNKKNDIIKNKNYFTDNIERNLTIKNSNRKKKILKNDFFIENIERNLSTNNSIRKKKILKNDSFLENLNEKFIKKDVFSKKSKIDIFSQKLYKKKKLLIKKNVILQNEIKNSRTQNKLQKNNSIFEEKNFSHYYLDTGTNFYKKEKKNKTSNLLNSFTHLNKSNIYNFEKSENKNYSQIKIKKNNFNSYIQKMEINDIFESSGLEFDNFSNKNRIFNFS